VAVEELILVGLFLLVRLAQAVAVLVVLLEMLVEMELLIEAVVVVAQDITEVLLAQLVMEVRE
jgi:hypothetical protein